MKIHLATHHGMCFGVRDALRAAHDAAMREPVTLLGQLVHNPVVDRHMRSLGARPGALDGGRADTRRVVITAHGASEKDRLHWREAGHLITDTTCPLVRKAHEALAMLVREGCHPVVIGQANHVEVRGLTGDFPGAFVIETGADAAALPFRERYGIVSQTTQPLERVLALVEVVKRRHPGAQARFMDTVCRPTKLRQEALEDLCVRCEVVIVIGGRASNNTRQLLEKALRLGVRAHLVETAADLLPEWLRGAENIGVTAGTSTLDETVRAVMDRLQTLAC
ncbi:MAG TPA: 4-hydroxy-3-methylbut-2-enyl diphosphate reductase [Verrucomicrobiales bacterium]|nr:4-hydroxy-3-methylbut-2-enyl diphosphate reductase [Verrucomicrobiales bacterium]HRJ08204.1 4-hydroxy-3-methylbut-2-enyl diphosphate reductase [Prosthecobacter sp.]HRK16127.1 4-hydroxy-3-methylbut-2-enyl diphosphate reductase [Prosthecobacter sp.]